MTQPLPMTFEGYVILSANGMLADSNHAMPPELKFEADQKFFEAALDRADLIVHGRHSFEDQPRSPLRKRIVLTHHISTFATDPANPRATLWNPAGASFDEVSAYAGVTSGIVAIIGGPMVFDMFMDRYDVFWLSEARRVVIPDGLGGFPGIPERTAHAILTAHGLKAAEVITLDSAQEVDVTAWRRTRPDI